MAIATYERTLLPDESPFDLYVAGNASAMTADQVAGRELFRDSVCSQCHTPPLFTTNDFARTGLRTRFDDNGLQVFTKNTADFGHFKIPSLRNVGLRKALTHVGWITDVQDAIDFYNAGTHDTGHTIFPNGLSTVADPDYRQWHPGRRSSIPAQRQDLYQPGPHHRTRRHRQSGRPACRDCLPGQIFPAQQ